VEQLPVPAFLPFGRWLELATGSNPRPKGKSPGTGSI